MAEHGQFPIPIDETKRALERHLEFLTVDIGERSVNCPENLRRAAAYIASVYEDIGLPVTFESYRYRDFTVANVSTEIRFAEKPSRRYLLGAHYDSLRGTVGADDNASGVAVLLETARLLNSLKGTAPQGVAVKCVSFTLEEHPAFWTPYRGSWVHARRAKKAREQIDGMLCLEMVGYFCREPGCQKYPFPLMHLDYPKTGDFIAIVGDSQSKELTDSVLAAFAENGLLPSQSLTVPFKGWLSPFVRRSDHVSFWDLGYKAVMVTDTANFRNPHYHRKTDTLEKLDFFLMAQLVEGLLFFFCTPKGS